MHYFAHGSASIAFYFCCLWEHAMHIVNMTFIWCMNGVYPIRTYALLCALRACIHMYMSFCIILLLMPTIVSLWKTGVFTTYISKIFSVYVTFSVWRTMHYFLHGSASIAIYFCCLWEHAMHTVNMTLIWCISHMHWCTVYTTSMHTCYPSAADEAWYWPKHVLHSGWLCITSRPVL